MNEFYSICTDGEDPKDEYQLKNLGNQVVSSIISIPVSGEWNSRGCYRRIKNYKKTTSEDYDKLLVNKLTRIKPSYDLYKILDYHLKYYLSKNDGDKSRFLDQIKYVVLPIIRKKKDNDIFIELISEWITNQKPKIQDKQSNSNISIGEINAPTQITVNSDNSLQYQQLSFSKEDIIEFIQELKKDINSSKEELKTELKDEFQNEINNTLKQLNNNEDVSGRLLTIGTLIKDVGIGVFTNLISSPIFEAMKPLLELQ